MSLTRERPGENGLARDFEGRERSRAPEPTVGGELTSALDADAVASVERASPLPPPPAGASRAYAAPIRYRLR